MLALVFMDALHLHIKKRCGIDKQLMALGNQAGELALGSQLAGAPAFKEPGIGSQKLQLMPALRLHRPGLPELFAEQGCQRRIGQSQPSPRGDTIGHIGELIGPERSEIGEEIALHQLAVQGRHTIDVVGAQGREVRHAHSLAAAFINERHAAEDVVATGVAQPHLLQKAAIQFIDDLQMPRQQTPEEFKAPALECFRQQGVIGVSQRPGGDPPGLIPINLMLIHQQAHQLGHGDRWMGVVELHRPVFLKLFNRDATLEQAAQHVLQGAAHKEVLLLEP